MTIKEVCQMLNIPVEQGMKLAMDNGVHCGETEPLTKEQMAIIRNLALRVHRPGEVKVPPKASLPPKPVATTGGPAPTPAEVPSPEAPKELPDSKEPRAPRTAAMIDTCSLMHGQCEQMLRKLLPAMEKHGQKMIIPEKVIGELYKHRQNPEKQDAAAKALRLCQMLRAHDCLTVRGEDKDNFADNTFYVALSRYRTRYHMMLITQDRGLTRDVLKLNQLRSVKGYPVEVMRITGRGELEISAPY